MPGLILEVPRTRSSTIWSSPTRSPTNCARMSAHSQSMISALAIPRSPACGSLPRANVKIDRSYVSDCDTDGHNAGAVRSDRRACAPVRLKTVAEGIETHRESHKLQASDAMSGRANCSQSRLDKSKFMALLRRRIGVKRRAESPRRPDSRCQSLRPRVKRTPPASARCQTATSGSRGARAFACP